MARTITSDGNIDIISTGGVVTVTSSSGTSVITGDITITGNLTVSGTTTSFDTTNTNITGNTILLNNGESGAGISAVTAGIEIDRGTENNVSIRYNETTDKWELTQDGTTFTDIFTASDTGGLVADIVDDATPQLGGDLDVNGNSIVSVSDGNIPITPDGTGSVVISNVDIAAGEIDGTAIGANSASTGAFTTLGATTITGTTVNGTNGSYSNLTATSALTLNGVSVATNDTTTITLRDGANTPFVNVADNTKVVQFDLSGITTGTTRTVTFPDADITIPNLTAAEQTQLQNIDSVTITNTQWGYLGAADQGVSTTDTVSFAGVTATTADINGGTVNGISEISVGTGTTTAGTIATFSSTDSIIVPIGTTVERPGVPIAGMVRFNSTISALEFFDGATWIDASEGGSTGQLFTDSFVGDGSTLSFVMSQTADVEEALWVDINGVMQDPDTAYTVAGAILTFAEPPAPTDSIQVRNVVFAERIVTIADGDGDTYVHVEDTNDNDTIDFYTDGGRRAYITPTGEFLPGADNTYTLGSVGNAWSEVHATTFTGNVTGNADTATALATGRTISLTGDVTGTSAAFDGTGNVSITATVANDSHTHDANNLTGTTLASGVTGSSLTSVGTLGTVTVTGDATVGGVVTSGAIHRDVTDENLNLAGGTASNSGANLIIRGPDHPTTPNDFYVREGGTVISRWNASTSAWTWGISDLMTLDSGGDLTLSSGGVNNVTVTDNTTKNATHYIAFVDGSTGAQGIEVDSTGLSYNPSTNTLSTSVFSGEATSAQYADLAENYVADAEYVPGTVLAFGGAEEVTLSTRGDDRRVAGVVTTNPAHLMNSALEADFVAAIALQGRVPCKVTGSVSKGDMMVSNGDGTARAWKDELADPRMGSVIGKALEDFDGTVGTIEVVVGRV